MKVSTLLFLLKEWKTNHFSNNFGTKYSPDEKLIERLIHITKDYFKKIDSQDGPYEPNVSEKYVPRKIEVEFLSVLKEQRCLQLTGISFCGKSEMAKYLADHFHQEGYIYKRALPTFW